MSDHGGHKSTMLALRRAGLVLFDETLTPAGLEMVARLKTPNAANEGPPAFGRSLSIGALGALGDDASNL